MVDATLLPREVVAGLLQLGAYGVGVLTERHDLGVIIPQDSERHRLKGSTSLPGRLVDVTIAGVQGRNPYHGEGNHQAATGDHGASADVVRHPGRRQGGEGHDREGQ